MGCCQSSKSVNYALTTTAREFNINLKIVEAKGLLNSDACGGKSDPYCKVFVLGPNGWQLVYKTKILSNTLDPVWNESVTFPGVVECQAFEVRIYDSDTMSDDEPLGAVPLFMDKFANTAKSGKPADQWFMIKGTNMDGEFKTEGAKGELRLQIKKENATSDQKAAAPAPGEKYKINLKVLSATDLVNSDMCKSDPYCKVFVLGVDGWNKVHKTNICNNTCNPSWDEEIVFEGTHYCQAVEVRIYDSDLLDDDQPLGSVHFFMDKFAKTAMSGKPDDQTFVIKGKNMDGEFEAEGAKGKLRLQILKDTSEGPLRGA